MDGHSSTPATVVLSSGNILHKSVSWKKGNEAASDEVFESLKSCLEGSGQSNQSGDVYEVVGDDGMNGGDEDVHREELKVSLKVFLYSLEKSDLVAAVDKGLELAAASIVDTLVIAFFGRSEGSPLTLDIIKSTWLVMEDMVQSGKAKVIGLCDVDTQLFIQLHAWAKVKPGIVQINLASCCVVPPELATYCKAEEVQLLTHSDPINVLNQERLDSLFKMMTSIEKLHKEGAAWELKWLLRYQVHLKCRGVLATKGYSAAIKSLTME